MKNGKMSKKEIGLYMNYRRATARTLSDLYACPSTRKQRAYEHYREVCYLLNGFDLRLPSASAQRFALAFRYYSKETGAESLFYATGVNEYTFEINGAQVPFID